MYDLLHDLLSDKISDTVFTCFSLWHWTYILLTALAVTLTVLYLKNKDEESKHRIIRGFSCAAFVLYALDFFLMPLAYGEIDIEKLPFHACTAMCVVCFISEHNALLKKYRIHFALLGFISNVTYLLYPAGVMWYGIHPLSYRVIQTLLFHACMTAYGILMLIYDGHRLEWKKCCRELAIIICMTLWAMLGNFIYNGNSGDYNHFFNWFFVVRDPFYIIPENISRIIMPPINIAVFFAAEMLVYLVCIKVRKSKRTTF